MASDDLVPGLGDDIRKGKGACRLAEIDVGENNEQEITQLAGQRCRVAAVDGVGNLVAFLQQIVLERRMRLLQAPGATLGRGPVQAANDGKERLDAGGRLIRRWGPPRAASVEGA
jgi:hypothetical protein